MEVEFRNNTSQMMPLIFDNGDEYELEPEDVIILPLTAGAHVEAQEDKIILSGIQSPLETDDEGLVDDDEPEVGGPED